MPILLELLNPFASSNSDGDAAAVGAACTTFTLPLSSRRRMYLPFPACPEMFAPKVFPLMLDCNGARSLEVVVRDVESQVRVDRIARDVHACVVVREGRARDV